MTVSDLIPANAVRILTRHPAGMVRTDYLAADCRIEGEWLLVTHGPPESRALSRVPLASVASATEAIPGKKAVA